jgi:FAD binding domain
VTTSETVAPASLDMLRIMGAGDVFAPGDHGYDQARRAWELAVDQRPAVVVFPESVVDVVRAIRFSRSQGLRIAPQATGHAALPLERLEDAMLLRTSRMRRVDVFPAIRTARAEAGARWEGVTVPAGEYGLAALAGTSPNGGMTGYTLGGGLSWLARRQQRDRGRDRDRGWPPRASRRRPRSGHLLGGQRRGRSVGIVTALEMTLYLVAELHACTLLFPIERGAEILHAWRRWTDAVTDESPRSGGSCACHRCPRCPNFCVTARSQARPARRAS